MAQKKKTVDEAIEEVAEKATGGLTGAAPTRGGQAQMDWIVTFGPPLTYARLAAALTCLGIEAPPEDYVIPLDKGEASIEISAPQDKVEERILELQAETTIVMSRQQSEQVEIRRMKTAGNSSPPRSGTTICPSGAKPIAA